MKTQLFPQEQHVKHEKYIYFLATVSLAVLSVLLYKNADFSKFSNPFNKDNNNVAGVTASKDSKKDVFTVSSVVTAALAFKATLTTTQQSTLQQTYTATLARKWSNLPCGSTCRNGVKFGDLTTEQLTAALAVLQEATGSGTNNGYAEFLAIRAAEEALQATAGGTNYDEGNYWISFLGTPSTTGAWMLQFGGHHFAANIAFNNGHVIGATPYFMGVEPTSYTVNGTAYAPMEDERTAFRNMLGSLSSTQFSTAKLSTTFSDCLMSPGESNGNTNSMPSTKQGLVCSGLSTAQKNYVIEAMRTYVEDLDATTAASLMALYTSELDQTYIAFTGSATAGSASTFLTSNTNYVRIDGPHIWIEFVCQTGVIFPSQIHYHTVWRDHVSDYGGDLSGSSIDNLATKDFSTVSNSTKIKIHPNPTTDILTVTNEEGFSNGTIVITDMSGKRVLSQKVSSGTSENIKVNTLANGTYLIQIQNKGMNFNSKFIKK